MKIKWKRLIFPGALIYSYLRFDLNVFLGLVLIILSHELGHAILAYKQGIFIRFDISHRGNPAVVTIGEFNNKVDHFSGILGNVIFTPIISKLLDIDWIMCFVIFLVMGMFDIYNFGVRWMREKDEKDKRREK